MLRIVLAAIVVSLGGCVMTNSHESIASLEEAVRNTETAFADTMARRDFDGFRSFLAEDTIFFAGEKPLRGSDTVAAAWKPFYESELVPFSWAPATVVVQDGGRLALSTGPVYAPDGRQVAVFNSIWRREEDGSWKIIFDKGGQYCPE